MWFVIVFGFLAVIGILGNGQVMYLIVTRRRLHTKANWFVLSLAVADLILILVLILPVYFCGTLIFDCGDEIVNFISYSGYASVTNTVALTVDRYCAIVLPLRYTQILTKKVIMIILFTAWLAPFILQTLPAILLPRLMSNGRGEEIEQLTTVIIFKILPCFVLAVAAGRMINIARRHAKRTSVLLKQLRFNQVKQQAKPEVSSARLITIMVAIFLMCYVCHSLSSLCVWIPSCKKNQPEVIVGETLVLLLIVNSGANPFVYALFKRDIKREFHQLYGSRKQRNQASRDW